MLSSPLTVTTASPTCTNSGLINCIQPKMLCYPDVSPLYSGACCATCAMQRNPELGDGELFPHDSEMAQQVKPVTYLLSTGHINLLRVCSFHVVIYFAPLDNPYVKEGVLKRPA